MKYVLYSFCLILFMSCKSQNFKLEPEPEFVIKEATYKTIPSGMYKGETVINVTLNFNAFNTKSIVFDGLYFRNKFLKIEQIDNTFKFVAAVVKAPLILEETQNSQFKLKPFEAVLAYTNKGKKKYVKYKLQRNTSLEDVPM